ncbi:hypothetical protein FHR56_002790 [Xanthomonas sacchari]|uniref:hypothetical protein n=1 Tax=unclassified Xanthomonas TaxID=2643310 RepID=UPI001371459B|nr:MULTISPECIES: hypothetical protein [unclassified Xanthomonas]MBB6367625.1 hypothetical protein [Xanthomonas sp. F10]
MSIGIGLGRVGHAGGVPQRRSGVSPRLQSFVTLRRTMQDMPRLFLIGIHRHRCRFAALQIANDCKQPYL